MDSNTKTTISNVFEVLDYWKDFPVDDIDPLKLNQKTEQTINAFEPLLLEIIDAPIDPSNQYLSFVWSVSVRDFTILLRDSLLASVKEEQLKKDGREIAESYIHEVHSIIQKAAKEVKAGYTKSQDSNFDNKLWTHQESPVLEIINQLKELQKQIKKIYRSSSKIDDLRFNISDYIKDFHLQYSRQSNAVKQLFSIVEEVQQIVHGITSESSDTNVNVVVDQLGEYSQKLEMVQGTESIDILPYANNETLSIPVSTNNGLVNFKAINIKSEFARWFSSFIYPKVIELESKRDHAVEKCLLGFSQLRTKIAAISLAENDDMIDIQKDFDSTFSLLNKEVLKSLKHEEEGLNALVSSHQDKYLLASNVYSSEMLFLPESGSSQISNISKDAQKRLVNNFEKYRAKLKKYTNKILSRYFEVDKTPYSQYIKNQVSIYDEDDSLALFLKKGYLGKSFTVPRPEIINPIVEDYNLWLDGFAGAILLSGLTGSGKSTVLGMINHLGLGKEIIQLHYGESYFIQHRSFDPKYDLKELIDAVVDRTRGRQVVVCIDDLERWHDDENDLFDNISKLFEAIVKYRRKVFFVVACSPFLEERIQKFKDLKTIFSQRTKLGRMNSNQLRNALNLRARVNDKVKIDEVDLESRYNHIIRESKGNSGRAMMEYCRFHNEDYKQNMKSLEFNELIDSYHTLLMYISSYHHSSTKKLSETLSEIDYRETIESINHLVGQKVLVRPKKGHVAINPLLVHNVEQSLSKLV